MNTSNEASIDINTSIARMTLEVVVMDRTMRVRREMISNMES